MVMIYGYEISHLNLMTQGKIILKVFLDLPVLISYGGRYWLY